MSDTFHSEAGKGSHQRPSEVSKDEYASNWDRIFGKKAEAPCKSCHGEGKVADGGYWYDCALCRAE